MDLPEELLYLIIYNCSLTSIKNLSSVGKKFYNIICHIDWDTYVKINNSLIDCENINCDFMKEQGCYLINVKDYDIINSWKFCHPYVETICNIVKNKDYNDKIKEYFNSGIHWYGLSFELSYYTENDGTILTVHISSTGDMFYHIHSKDKSYGEHIDDLEIFLKKYVSSTVCNYIRCDLLDDESLFIIENNLYNNLK